MLLKVKIKNFLSIKDEQLIKLNSNITSIIGKNESGKTTILKAISKLNKDPITKSEKNVSLKEEESFIEGYFKISKDEIKRINKEYSSDKEYAFYALPEEYDNLYFSIKVNETKISYYSLYYMDEDNQLQSISTSMFTDRIKKEIHKILKNEKSEEAINFLKDIEKISDVEIKEKIKNINLFPELKEKLISLSEEIQKNHWIDLLPKYKFITFSSFSDVLKDNVLYSELENNKQAKNILSIAKIDIEKLGKAFDIADEQELEDLQTKYINIVSKKFKEIFQQTDEDFKLKIRFGSSKKEIIFLTQDKTSGTSSINLSQRSEGFKWYLSLYLTLYEYLNKVDKNINYVLLLDEPNLYLHPGAQNNLLYNVFYKEFSDVQILYTTHSPYMIDSNNSFSIRIVEKDQQTRIYNSSREYAERNKKIKDVDTLSPLMTALELHVSNSLIINKTDILIAVEGIQDVYILRAMIKKNKLDKKFENIKIISGMSAEKVPYMFSYLFGMGYNTYCLVDNDKSGRKVINTITNYDKSDELKNKIIKYDLLAPSETDFLLEDLFSKNDKEKYLSGKSTVLYKRILDEIDSIELEKDTVTNFNKFLEALIKIVTR